MTDPDARVPDLAPPPRTRKSRPFTMFLVGAAALSSCMCCLFPAPQPDAPPGQDETGGGEFGGDQVAAADPADPARPADEARAQAEPRRYGYMPFWMPLFFGGGFNRGPMVGGARPATAPGVTRGGFGNVGRGFTGAGS